MPYCYYPPEAGKLTLGPKDPVRESHRHHFAKNVKRDHAPSQRDANAIKEVSTTSK